TSANARSSKLASRGAASSPDALIAAMDYLARGAFGDCAALPTVTSADAQSCKLASRGAASSPDALIAATNYLARGAFGDCTALPTAAFSVISPLGGTGIVKQRDKGPAVSTGCHLQQRQRTDQLTEITV
ncbi:hypothetical protein MRX96_050995, partial [Rhipicephalus microplus]